MSEHLYTNTEITVKTLCNQIQIPFKSSSLNWEKLGKSFTGHEKWHEHKKKDLTHRWHGNAMQSTGFTKPRQYEIDKDGDPTFSEVADLEHRDICKKLYKENIEYYQLFLKEQANQ